MQLEELLDLFGLLCEVVELLDLLIELGLLDLQVPLFDAVEHRAELLPRGPQGVPLVLDLLGDGLLVLVVQELELVLERGEGGLDLGLLVDEFLPELVLPLHLL